MSAATTPKPSSQTQPVHAREDGERTSLRRRLSTLVSSALAAALGLLPHVLHHVGPLAGAALLAGTGGTSLFGAIGLFAAIPFLLRVHRHCRNWRMPAGLMAVFAVTFSFSAFVLGPTISGDGGSATEKPTPTRSAPAAPAAPQEDGHAAHHR